MKIRLGVFLNITREPADNDERDTDHTGTHHTAGDTTDPGTLGFTGPGPKEPWE